VVWEWQRRSFGGIHEKIVFIVRRAALKNGDRLSRVGESLLFQFQSGQKNSGELLLKKFSVDETI
jgi:hypothetical protein